MGSRDIGGGEEERKESCMEGQPNLRMYENAIKTLLLSKLINISKLKMHSWLVISTFFFLLTAFGSSVTSPGLGYSLLSINLSGMEPALWHVRFIRLTAFGNSKRSDKYSGMFSRVLGIELEASCMLSSYSTKMYLYSLVL